MSRKIINNSKEKSITIHRVNKTRTRNINMNFFVWLGDKYHKYKIYQSNTRINFFQNTQSFLRDMSKTMMAQIDIFNNTFQGKRNYHIKIVKFKSNSTVLNWLINVRFTLTYVL